MYSRFSRNSDSNSLEFQGNLEEYISSVLVVSRNHEHMALYALLLAVCQGLNTQIIKYIKNKLDIFPVEDALEFLENL